MVRLRQMGICYKPGISLRPQNLLSISTIVGGKAISRIVIAGAGITLSSLSFVAVPTQDDGFTHGAALPDDSKLWLSLHSRQTFDEVRSRYREEQKAKQRSIGPKLH